MDFLMTKNLDAIRRPMDSGEMRAAITWLEKQGLLVRRPTEWQLKVGPINFYPDRGTIICDGEVEPLQSRGLGALRDFLVRNTNCSADVIMLSLDR